MKSLLALPLLVVIIMLAITYKILGWKLYI